jgi:hypothetical protein
MGTYYISLVSCWPFLPIATVFFLRIDFVILFSCSSLFICMFVFDVLHTPSGCNQICRCSVSTCPTWLRAWARVFGEKTRFSLKANKARSTFRNCLYQTNPTSRAAGVTFPVSLRIAPAFGRVQVERQESVLCAMLQNCDRAVNTLSAIKQLKSTALHC